MLYSGKKLKLCACFRVINYELVVNVCVQVIPTYAHIILE